jgi:hypothetical protein
MITSKLASAILIMYIVNGGGAVLASCLLFSAIRLVDLRLGSHHLKLRDAIVERRGSQISAVAPPRGALLDRSIDRLSALHHTRLGLIHNLNRVLSALKNLKQ